MNMQSVKRLLAFICIIGCIASLCGCSELIEYVDSYVPPTTPEYMHTAPGDTEPDDPGDTAPEATEPAQPTLVGIVTGAGVLNVRSGPGTEYEKVGELDEGTKVAIYERQQVGDSAWGRIKSGWISMNYIVIEDDDDKKESTTTYSIIATVTTNDLNVRSGPGTGYDAVTRVNTGDKVQITEICVLGKILWGKYKQGWLCMSYVTIDGSSDGGLHLSGKVNTEELMIRSAPGTDAKAVGKYQSGDTVVITELRSVSYVPWGKTDKGWVCMNYVLPDGNIIVSAGS